jgi:hypothetical protein
MLYLANSLVREGTRALSITMIVSREIVIILEETEGAVRELKPVEIETISSRWLKR